MKRQAQVPVVPGHQRMRGLRAIRSGIESATANGLMLRLSGVLVALCHAYLRPLRQLAPPLRPRGEGVLEGYDDGRRIHRMTRRLPWIVNLKPNVGGT